MRLATILLAALLLVSGCSWMPFVDSEKEIKEKEAKALEGLSEKEFYDRIQRNLQSRNWADAIANLQGFEAQFPFGNYAEQAQLELIYAYTESMDYPAAIAAAERFIRLHPRHPNVDYAHYIKGVAAISQSKGLFSNYMPIDETRRDPGDARQAFASFSELLSRYPNSGYAADARKRMVHLRNMLARHEIHVANYYFKRGAYLAAVNRGRYVVENFQQTPAVPDGLAVMAQGYHMIGLLDLASDAAQVLAINYSDHPSLDKQGQFKYQQHAVLDDKSWPSRLTLGYFKTEKPPFFDSRTTYDPVQKSLAELKNETSAPDHVQTTSPTHRSWLNRISFGILN